MYLDKVIHDQGLCHGIFILVIGGFILAYLLFIVAWEPLFQKFAGKWFTPKPRPEELPEDSPQTELSISEERSELIQEEVPVKEEESVPAPMPFKPMERPKLDWKEIHEKEVQEKHIRIVMLFLIEHIIIL